MSKEITGDKYTQDKKHSHNASKVVAWLRHDALLFLWLVTLVWRQRNIRECRIAGSKPNLFKAKIPPFTGMTMPPWAREKLMANPDEQFWQIYFRESETKMGHEVRVLLPLRLVARLEEYLDAYRVQLVSKTDPPETLFLNRDGGPLTQLEFCNLIEGLTARYVQKAVNPHLFRDIFAYAWLDAYPENYLTLQKALWHRDIKTTLRRYGSGIDESHALCRVEQWLHERDKKASQQKKDNKDQTKNEAPQQEKKKAA